MDRFIRPNPDLDIIGLKRKHVSDHNANHVNSYIRTLDEELLGSKVFGKVKYEKVKEVKMKFNRMFDAPECRDDFYTTIIDIHQIDSIFGICLGHTIYTSNVDRSETCISNARKLAQTNEENDLLAFTSVAFANTQRCSYVAAGTLGGNLLIYDYESLHNERKFDTYYKINKLLWRGPILYSAHRGNGVQIRDTRIQSSLIGCVDNYYSQYACGLLVSQDERMICIGSDRNAVTIWDNRSLGDPLHVHANYKAAVKGMCWIEDSKIFATGGGTNDPRVKILSIDNTVTERNSYNAEHQISGLDLYEGNIIASTRKYGQTAISLRASDLQKNATFNIEIDDNVSRPICQVISYTQDILFTIHASESVLVWDLLNLKNSMSTKKRKYAKKSVLQLPIIR